MFPGQNQGQLVRKGRELVLGVLTLSDRRRRELLGSHFAEEAAVPERPRG